MYIILSIIRARALRAGEAHKEVTMSKKAIVILIVAMAVVAVAASIGVAYVIEREDSGMALTSAGDEFTDSARIEGMLPGQSSVQEYKANAPGGATFILSLMGGHSSDLARYLHVSIKLNGTELYGGAYLGCKGVIYTAKVSGDFTFSVTYSLPQDVGNGAQSKECDITLYCSLQETEE